MARPSKLSRFADMKEYPHVFEPDKLSLMQEDYLMKGQWKQQFFRNEQAITLELGCGRGEYTVGLAEMFPKRNFIGMDIKGARMWKGATYSQKAGLENVGFVRARIEFVDRIFAPGEIDEIWVTFPDPQPKKASRRLIHAFFLNKYLQLLKPDGIIHLKTDSRLLHEYLLATLQQNSVEPLVATRDLYSDYADSEACALKTRYEELFLAEGKPINYLSFTSPQSKNLLIPNKFNEQKWL